MARRRSWSAAASIRSVSVSRQSRSRSSQAFTTAAIWESCFHFEYQVERAQSICCSVGSWLLNTESSATPGVADRKSVV